MNFSKLFITCGAIGSATVAYYAKQNDDLVSNFHEILVNTRKFANASTRDLHYPGAADRQIWDKNWDKRDPYSLMPPSELQKGENPENEKTLEETIKEYTAEKVRHLIFIRHGQYNTKEEDDKNRTLTELGREQAVYTGMRLKDMNIKFDKIVESTMARAIETSSLVQDQLKDVTVERTDLLREGLPCFPEPPFKGWRNEVGSHTDGSRIEAAFRKYIHRADPSQKEHSIEVYVCHANVIRYFVCRALQVSPEAWLRISLRHGSLTWLSVYPDGHVSVRCVGEAGHIPIDKMSFQ